MCVCVCALGGGGACARERAAARWRGRGGCAARPPACVPPRPPTHTPPLRHTHARTPRCSRSQESAPAALPQGGGVGVHAQPPAAGGEEGLPELGVLSSEWVGGWWERDGEGGWRAAPPPTHSPSSPPLPPTHQARPPSYPLTMPTHPPTTPTHPPNSTHLAPHGSQRHRGPPHRQLKVAGGPPHQLGIHAASRCVCGGGGEGGGGFDRQLALRPCSCLRRLDWARASRRSLPPPTPPSRMHASLVEVIHQVSLQRLLRQLHQRAAHGVAQEGREQRCGACACACLGGGGGGGRAAAAAAAVHSCLCACLCVCVGWVGRRGWTGRQAGRRASKQASERGGGHGAHPAPGGWRQPLRHSAPPAPPGARGLSPRSPHRRTCPCSCPNCATPSSPRPAPSTDASALPGAAAAEWGRGSARQARIFVLPACLGRCALAPRPPHCFLPPQLDPHRLHKARVQRQWAAMALWRGSSRAGASSWPGEGAPPPRRTPAGQWGAGDAGGRAQQARIAPRSGLGAAASRAPLAGPPPLAPPPRAVRLGTRHFS